MKSVNTGPGLSDASAAAMSQHLPDTPMAAAPEDEYRRRAEASMGAAHPKASDAQVVAFATRNMCDAADTGRLAYIAAKRRNWKVFHALVDRGIDARPFTADYHVHWPPWILALLDTEPPSINANKLLYLSCSDGDIDIMRYVIASRDKMQYTELGLSLAALSFLECTTSVDDAFAVLDEMHLAPRFYTLACGFMASHVVNSDDHTALVNHLSIRLGCGADSSVPLYEAYANMPHAMDVLAVGADGDPAECIRARYLHQYGADIDDLMGLVSLEHGTSCVLQVAAKSFKWGRFLRLVEEGAAITADTPIIADDHLSQFPIKSPSGAILYYAAHCGEIAVVRYILANAAALPHAQEVYTYLPAVAAANGCDMAAKWMFLNLPIADYTAALVHVTKVLLTKSRDVATLSCLYAFARSKVGDDAMHQFRSAVADTYPPPGDTYFRVGAYFGFERYHVAIPEILWAFNPRTTSLGPMLQTAIDAAAGRWRDRASELTLSTLRTLKKGAFGHMVAVVAPLDPQSATDMAALVAAMCHALRAGLRDFVVHLLHGKKLGDHMDKTTLAVYLCEASTKGQINECDCILDAAASLSPMDVYAACRVAWIYACELNRNDIVYSMLKHRRLAGVGMALLADIASTTKNYFRTDRLLCHFGLAIAAITEWTPNAESMVEKLVLVLCKRSNYDGVYRVLQTVTQCNHNVSGLVSVVLAQIATDFDRGELGKVVSSPIATVDEKRLAVERLAKACAKRADRLSALKFIMRYAPQFDIAERIRWDVHPENWSTIFQESEIPHVLTMIQTLALDKSYPWMQWLPEKLRGMKLRRSDRETLKYMKRRYVMNCKTEAYKAIFESFNQAHADAEPDPSWATDSRICCVCFEQLMIPLADTSSVSETIGETAENDHSAALTADPADADNESVHTLGTLTSSVTSHDVILKLMSDSEALSAVVARCPGKHLMHRECFFSWYRRQKNCPMCCFAL